MEILWYRW